MCRALKVLCVAKGREALRALTSAAVSADWELVGASSEEEALRLLHEERPHVLVVFGSFARLVAKGVDAAPALRIVADRDLPGADAVVASLADVREAVAGRSRPGGPVR